MEGGMMMVLYSMKRELWWRTLNKEEKSRNLCRWFTCSVHHTKRAHAGERGNKYVVVYLLWEPSQKKEKEPKKKLSDW